MAKINWKSLTQTELEDNAKIKEKREIELLKEYNKAIIKLANLQAVALAPTLSTTQLLEIKYLFPQWDTLIGKSIKKASIPYLMYGDKLYMVNSNHTPQLNRVPGIGIESLYSLITEPGITTP